MSYQLRRQVAAKYGHAPYRPKRKVHHIKWGNPPPNDGPDLMPAHLANEYLDLIARTRDALPPPPESAIQRNNNMARRF
jgi:hypothetical protein